MTPKSGGQLTSSDALSNMKSRRREQTWNIYAGFSKSFGDKLALDASLAVEHYKTPVWNSGTGIPSST